MLCAPAGIKNLSQPHFHLCGDDLPLVETESCKYRLSTVVPWMSRDVAASSLYKQLHNGSCCRQRSLCVRDGMSVVWTSFWCNLLLVVIHRGNARRLWYPGLVVSMFGSSTSGSSSCCGHRSPRCLCLPVKYGVCVQTMWLTSVCVSYLLNSLNPKRLSIPSDRSEGNSRWWMFPRTGMHQRVWHCLHSFVFWVCRATSLHACVIQSACVLYTLSISYALS